MEKSEQRFVNDSSPGSGSPERDGNGDLEGAYLARTRSGEALSPQPADDPADPLNWPLSLKVDAILRFDLESRADHEQIGILLQVGLLAALPGINVAAINPAILQISKELHVSKINASYQT